MIDLHVACQTFLIQMVGFVPPFWVYVDYHAFLKLVEGLSHVPSVLTLSYPVEGAYSYPVEGSEQWPCGVPM